MRESQKTPRTKVDVKVWVDVFAQSSQWPYLATLLKLMLALGLGLFVGLERERHGKEAGVRTFAFCAALGCAGGLLGDNFAILSLILLIPFVIFLNLHSLRKESETEMTTSAALFIIGFVGVMCGKGHTFTPVAIGLSTAGLLAWKGSLNDFSVGITEAELRSAILLGVLAFVIYPVLPNHTVDPWGLFDPRAIWSTIILIAAIGFANYILLKIYGSRGIEAAGFLAGLVNSTVAVVELASRVKSDSSTLKTAYRGTMLATAAMLLRNGVILLLLSPSCFWVAFTPLVLMLASSAGLAFAPWTSLPNNAEAPPNIELSSPFSLKQTFKFGTIFLAISVIGTLGERVLGSGGFFVVSGFGGLVSSASSVASAGQLAAHGELTAWTGGIGAVIAALTSATVGIPLIARVAQNRQLTRLVSISIAAVVLVGTTGIAISPLVSSAVRHPSHLPASVQRDQVPTP